jgi:hypothetical protein
MTNTPAASPRSPRSRVGRLFAAALNDDEQALRTLHLLAFVFIPGTAGEVLEARRAVRAIDGPRPDGSCPPDPAGWERGPWATAYADQLRARFRAEPAEGDLAVSRRPDVVGHGATDPERL